MYYADFDAAGKGAVPYDAGMAPFGKGGAYGKGGYPYGKGGYPFGKGKYPTYRRPYWRPTPGGGLAKQYPPGMVGIPYAYYPGYGLVQ